MTSRKLQLNRETVRVLSSREMAGVAGGMVLKTLTSGPISVTNCACTTRATVRCTAITEMCTIKA